MENVDEVVLRCYTKVLEESGIDILPKLNANIGRESGLDSMGLVSLMIEIEEALNITLETVLIGIRQSSTLLEIVPLVKKVYEESRR